MRKTLIIIAAVMAAFPLRAQNLESVLSSVERNNTTLKVLRAEADAAKAEARTGLTPADPELELGYLWGTPKEEGNRIDLGLTQSFDFPTVYRFRKLIADGEEPTSENLGYTMDGQYVWVPYIPVTTENLDTIGG